MPARLQHIRILSDGRAGHENQSTGLALALQRRCGATVETVPLDPTRSVFHRIGAARSQGAQPPPDLLIAAGHRTHLPLLFAARKFRARSVVIMKPSLPAGWFDLCLIPRHDLGGRTTANANIIPTFGALNRISEDVPVKSAKGLIMIGGPSAHHAWDPEPLLTAIRAVVGAAPELKWTLGNSRRTPDRFLEQVAVLSLPLEIVPCGNTTPDWLPQQLLGAAQAWITADSTSMISESFTARARTGILPMPARSPDSRVVLAVGEFIRSGLAVPYSEWQHQGWPEAGPVETTVHEAARCAGEILTRFFT